MKTFKDLKFKKHPVKDYFDFQAEILFDNNYGVSVINGKSAYCGIDTFEVAVLFNSEITYNSGFTNDVLGYQTKSDIDILMANLQNL